MLNRNHAVTCWDPFRDMDEFEKQFFGFPARPFEANGFGAFKTDIKDEGDKYVIEADMPGFNKEDIKGDLNGDRVLNAKDLTVLKRAVLYDNLDSFWRPLGDLNDDGAVDKKDVKELIRRLTGAPEEDPEETDVTTTGTDATVPPRPETTTDPYWDYPLYGPPSAWN